MGEEHRHFTEVPNIKHYRNANLNQDKMAHLTLAGAAHIHTCAHIHTHTHICTHAHTLLARTGADLHGGNTEGHGYCVSPLGLPQAATTQHHRLGAYTQTFVLTALETEA